MKTKKEQFKQKIIAMFVVTFMFVMVFLLTKFLPRIFKEYFTKRELTVEVIATILVAIGSAFFVF